MISLDKFNERYPPGSPFMYHHDTGDPYLVTVISKAWMYSDSLAVKVKDADDNEMNVYIDQLTKVKRSSDYSKEEIRDIIQEREPLLLELARTFKVKIPPQMIEQILEGNVKTES